jgi:hypothetical protein
MTPTDSSRESIKIEFQITEVLNRSLRQLRLTTEATTHIYHSLINFNVEKFSPLQTDSLPITITDPFTDLKPELTKERALIWLFRKAFEEFIVGLTESLIEAHKFSKLYNLANLTINHDYTKEEIEAKVKEINKKARKLNFPTLINEIEKELNISMPLKAEIISINQVRNCLVHRNSIVMDNDINNETNDCLKLCFLELITLSEKDGQIIEVKWEHKKDGFMTNKLGFDVRSKTISFRKGEQVVLDQNIFNGVTYTCITFAEKLLAILPKPY